MKNKSLFLVPLLFVVACDSNYFGRAITRNSSFDPNDVTSKPIDVPTGGNPGLTYKSVTAIWEDVAIEGAVAPEIVFVLDKSGSMSGEALALKNALAGWLDNLRSQGFENFCVDVMSSVIGTQSGKLQSASGNPKCLCTDEFGSDDDGIATIVQKFKENLDASVGGGSADDGGEAAFYSYQKSLTGSDVLSYNQGFGCYRTDMPNAVIFLSDENELSASLNGPQEPTCVGDTVVIEGTTFNLDQAIFENTPFEKTSGGLFTTSNPDLVTFSPKEASQDNCKEVTARLKYYSDFANPIATDTYELLITPQTVVSNLEDYNDPYPTFGSAVVYQAGVDAFPVSSENGPGHGYFEFADLLGQTTADLSTADNQSDFNDQLNVIGDALVQAISAIRIYTLPTPGVCETSVDAVEVKVNATTLSPSQFTVSSNRRKVTINNSVTIPLESDVTIIYITCE